MDLEVAMSGIDSLLKSQQLLFGAVGIAPALGILYISVSWLRTRLSQGADRRARAQGYDVKIRTWEAMRRINKLLDEAHESAHAGNSSSEEDKSLDAKTQGMLLLDLAMLRSAAEPLVAGASIATRRKGVRKSLRQQFLQDVRELEGMQSFSPASGSGACTSKASYSHAWRSRRATLDRMWRSWGPLFALHA